MKLMLQLGLLNNDVELMPADFSKLFLDLGLSQTETSVYLASLHLGPTSVQEIAKKARLSRTTAYESIALLQDRGLMSSYVHGKKKFFTAEDPERAVDHFRSRVGDLQSKIEAFVRVVPQLQMLSGGERPAVRFFEGKEALLALFHDLDIANSGHFDEVSNYDDIYKYLDVDYLKDIQRIVDPANMKTRILHRGKLQRAPRAGVEYCELAESLGDFHGDIWIYADRVAFVSFRGKIVGVIIESEPFAQTARVLFEAAWRICSKK